MFEKFSKEAKAAVILAQQEALERGDTRVGAEHLLVSVVATASDGVTALNPEDLRSAATRLDRAALESVGVVLEQEPPPFRRKKGHMPFSGAAKTTLEQALREAILLGDRRIGSEHILLAVTRLGSGDRAIRVLHEVGVDPEILRNELLARMRRAS